MKSTSERALRILLLATLAVTLAGMNAQTLAQHGKVKGKVTDATTGEALIGVNIFFEGTTQGTTTDLDGNYIVIGVRPGTYTLVASYLGYQTVRKPGVRVSIDLTTTEDFQLGEEIIQGQEIVVTAEQDLVRKDLTATTAVVDGERIRAIPVENLSDVIELQAGVVDGHFRGGRIGEVGYWVDGVPVTDVYDGSLGVSVENNTVQEVQVVTGAFNAEYGQALSGIVNVVTRDGANSLHGGFSGFAGDYASSADDVFENVDDVDPVAVRNFEADFSGPVIKDKLFFFTSGRYFENDGWNYGRRAFLFDDVGFGDSGRLELVNPSGSGDSSFVALDPFKRLSGQAKLNYRMSRAIRVVANAIFLREEGKEGASGEDRHRYRFIPDAQRNTEKNGRTAYAKITHTLSDRAFYEVGVTNTNSRFESFLFDDALSPEYRDIQIIDFRDQLTTSNFIVGGTDNRRFRRQTNTWLGKLDFTSQIDAYNLVKVGLEYRMHDLEFRDQVVVVLDQFGIDPFLFDDGIYDYEPVEFSAYAQDKIEIGSLIINGGIRFDHFDSNGKVFADPSDPNVVFIELRDQDSAFKDADPKSQASPRIGIAFPISDGGVIHFSYGWFFQVPNFELLYQNPFFRLNQGGSGLIGLIGNANLEPEKTINGEIGLKQQLSQSTALELTAYFRDIRNLTGTAATPISVAGTSARYAVLVNSDFGLVRGVVLRLDQRLGSSFFMNADYTFQVAKANASDPDQVFNAASAKQDLETQLVPTNWDQRHTANLSLSYRAASNWGFGLVGTYGSGTPYTPSQTTLQTGTILPTKIPLNSEFKPSRMQFDLSVYKDVLLGPTTLQLFAKVDNLFDNRNENGVFTDTGRATYSLQRNVEENTFRGDIGFLDRWYTRQDFYNEPRRVVLGLSYRF